MDDEPPKLGALDVESDEREEDANVGAKTAACDEPNTEELELPAVDRKGLFTAACDEPITKELELPAVD